MVAGFDGLPAVIPAHAEIQGKFLGHLPVIFGIRRKVAENVVLRIAGCVGGLKGPGTNRCTRYSNPSIMSATALPVPQSPSGLPI